MKELQVKTLQRAVKDGFTFRNDSHFKSFGQGNRVIAFLIKEGYLVKVDNGNGVEYQPTEKGRSFVKYGV